MSEYPKEYLDEALKLNLQLDRYEISSAMWWERIIKLRKKYKLPPIEDD